MADLHTDIRFLKGIGEKKALLFHKLGIFTLGDCLEDVYKRQSQASVLPTCFLRKNSREIAVIKLAK